MTAFRWNSLQDLFAIQEKVNRLFEETIHRTELPDEGLDTAIWSPAADVYESADEIVLNIELPGVRLEDVRLESLDGVLRVSGQRRLEGGPEAREFVRVERIYGNFSREFPVPVTLDPADIKATLRSGVLRVVAPKIGRSPAAAGASKGAR